MTTFFDKMKFFLTDKDQVTHPNLANLEKIINYTFRNKMVATVALTHTSHDKMQHEDLSFERMEFLGDAVLGLLVSEHIFHKYPDYSEGELSKLKAKIVSRKYLNLKAKEIELQKFLLLNLDASTNRSISVSSVLGNAMESLICAIFLDGGFQPTKKFIEKFILAEARNFISDQNLKNYKSILQEYFQSKGKEVPKYNITSEKGPEHKKEFTAEVFWENRSFGKGKGTTKKEAHQNAAKRACEKLNLK